MFFKSLELTALHKDPMMSIPIILLGRDMSNRICPKSVPPASRRGRFGVVGSTVAASLVVALAAIAVPSQAAP